MGATIFMVASLASARSASAQPPVSTDHQMYSQVQIDEGGRLYRNLCSQCHGPYGDLIAGVDLRRGVFRRSSRNEDIARVITAGIPGTGMPPSNLQATEVTALIAFIRAGFDPTATPIKVGDATRGKAVFDGKGSCNTCHRVRGVGPRVAPDLSDIGTLREPDALHASLVNPTSRMMPINRPIKIVMKDGTTITGRRVNEDTYSVQLIDDKERLRSILKSDTKSYVVETTSPMPSYEKRLTPDELADVVAYLMTLKG